MSWGLGGEPLGVLLVREHSVDDFARPSERRTFPNNLERAADDELPVGRYEHAGNRAWLVARRIVLAIDGSHHTG